MKALSAALVHALSAGVVVSLAATVAHAQTPMPTPQKIEKIEVTGSNIKRIEGESALPIQVISRDEILKIGATSAAQLIEKLQLNTGATYNVSQGVGDSGQPGFSGASLRGLGPNNTLILLNGRRIANYAFNGAAVDVNSIPLNAIERVEVLKDGASAVYGTDAIGGVINFILRKDFTGIEAAYYQSSTDRGGGDGWAANLTAGFGDITKDRFNVLVSYNQSNSDPLLAKQREFAATAIRPDLGIQQTSGNTWPAAIRSDATGGRGNANPLAASGCVPSAGSYYLPDVSTSQCRYDFTSVLDIYPPVETKSVVAKGAFQVNASIQLFADYFWVQNTTDYHSSETPINDFVGNGPFIYPANGPYYPKPFNLPNGTLITPTGPLSIAWRGKDTGRRSDQAVSEAQRIVAGLRGNLGSWDYEAAFLSAESKVTDTYTDGWLSESRMRAAIATGLVNPWSITGQTEAGQAILNAAKILQEVRNATGKVNSFDVRASSDIMQTASGPLSLAVGLETRREEYNDNPSAVQSSGDILGGGGNQPVASGDRNVTAVFLELNWPITKELEAVFALRSDRYSDFGSSTNPKIALRYTPNKAWLFRGSYNTGFRAPSLPDLYQPRFFSNTADTHSDPIRCPGGTPIGGYVDDGLECDAQFQNQLGGVSTLQPEKSKQATLGALFEPNNNVSIGLDGFWIQRTNSLQGLSDTTVFDYYGNLDPLNAGGYFVRNVRNASGGCVGDAPGSPTPANVPCSINYAVQVQQNVGTYTTSGLDVTAQANWTAGEWGKFRLGLIGTWIYKYTYQFAKNGPYTNNLGVFTADNGAVPMWRHLLSLDWSRGPWAATLTQNVVASYTDASGDRQVGSVETYDLVGQWTGFKGLQVTLGIKNLFDRDPPASNQGQTFQVGYDPRYGDPMGRTYFGRISYLFK
jgi:iron complex outermembrane recepter protein